MALDAWNLNPREVHNTNNHKINQKLWKCAKEVLELEQEILKDSNIEAPVKIHEFNLPYQRKVTISTGVKLTSR